MAIITRGLAIFTFCLFLCTGVRAETKIALIITNQDYPSSVGALANPHSDGERVANTLRRLGFLVVHKRDLDKGQMQAEVGSYVARLTEGGTSTVGFFYYAGHGAANSKYGENYLIPTAAPLTVDSQLALFGVKVGDVVDAIASTPAKINFVVLDACRNVPIQFAIRSAERGLRRESQRKGMLIAFATDPGKTATDAGYYAQALSEELERPGVEAVQIFKNVRTRILDATKDSQFPWHEDGLIASFYFSGDSSAPLKTPVTPDEAELEWRSVDKNSVAMLTLFAIRHSGSVYADYANARTKELQASQKPAPKAEPVPEEPRYYFVWDARPPDDWLDLRTGPNGRLIRHMRNGTAIEKLGPKSGKWLNVRIVETGEVGWTAWGNESETRVWIYCCRTRDAIPPLIRKYSE